MESVCADEAAAFEAVQHRLSGLDACASNEVVSGCMALFTLGCRHGLALVDAVEAIRLGAGLFVKWVESVSAVGDDYAAGAASSAVYTFISNEFVSKMPPETRAPAEKAGNHHGAKVMGCIKEVLTEQL